MQLVFLDEEKFDSYSKTHPLHSFYQTTNYGRLMMSCGNRIAYWGFIENNRIVGASLVIMQKLFKKYNYAYAPRGILTNYNDTGTLSRITSLLKEYLKKNNIVFFKIDPLVVNNVRDKKGNVLPYETNKLIIPNLQQIGYKYFGNNLYFETLKPRWNAFVKLDISSYDLFKSLEKNARNKIRKAISRCVEVYEGNINDMEKFYRFVARKHYRNIEYYYNFSRCFNTDFEIYLAKLNCKDYLKTIQELYQQLLDETSRLNENLLNAKNENKRKKILNKKLSDDKVLAIYKRELNYASNLINKAPDGILIGSLSLLKDSDKLHLLIDGFDSKFKPFYPSFLLKWHIIEKYHKYGYTFFDLNAVTGDFTPNNIYKGLNEMKTSFNAEIYEFVGEFDLVAINSVYEIYTKLYSNQNKLKKKTK